MRRVIVFGNSGSGKSTLARALAQRDGLAHLDLDTLAWRPVTPPERRPLDESRSAIAAFMAEEATWVIEGCYADLLAFAVPHATAAVWLDLPVEACIANARRRPFEAHKYPTPEDQDANLPILIDWISAYDTRDDTLSRRAHRELFDGFAAAKIALSGNTGLDDIALPD